MGRTIGRVLRQFRSAQDQMNQMVKTEIYDPINQAAKEPVKKQGPKKKVTGKAASSKPETFAEVDDKTNMPANSSILGLLFCAFWFFYFYAANLTAPVFGIFSFDSSELPIITIYGMYIPIFVMFMVKEGKKNIFKNAVMPVLGVIACAFMMFVAVYAHGIRPYQAAAAKGEFSFPVLFYLIVYAVIMGVGLAFYKKKQK
jgi:APA family basic amino acid/polyamine antiporter